MMIARPRISPRLKANIPAALALTVAVLGVSGCTPLLGGATTEFDKVAPGEAPVVIGPPVRDNYTPMNAPLACLANDIQKANQPKLTIAVDDIKDYTGQYNINEGDAITQGGSLMVMSALGKLGGTVNVADRFNTDVAQMELSFMNQRELGDGQNHVVGTGPAAKTVPWIPYYGGSILGSQYYITGGITELNYNVQSGGVQFQVNNLGPEDRVYTEDVGIDLELVDSKSLLVVKTVSLVKQLTGYEVGFNIFQFFGSNLYNLNIGNKSQEPEQLGVRTLLEEGVLRLVASAENIRPEPCLALATGWIPKKTAEEYLKEDQAANNAPVAAAPMAPAPVAAAPMAAPAAPPPVVEAAAPPAPAPEPAPAVSKPEEVTAPAAPAATPPAPPPASSNVTTAVAAAPSTLNSQTSSAPIQNGSMEAPSGQSTVKFDYGATDVTGGDMAALDQAAATARQHPVQVVLTAPANESWAPTKRLQLLMARVASVKKALSIRGILNVNVAWTPDPTAGAAVMDGSGSQRIALLVVSP
ncbi:MAG: CsgG/HfaB family protein [Acidocella sp.]|nr:CsgG/HfaB family protein [Acidocella sp.]